jgi:hypothetical protein
MFQVLTSDGFTVATATLLSFTAKLQKTTQIGPEQLPEAKRVPEFARSLDKLPQIAELVL